MFNINILTLSYLDRRQGTLIFQTQKIMEWSLKQSDNTPDFITPSGWVTRIQSNKDLDFDTHTHTHTR